MGQWEEKTRNISFYYEEQSSLVREGELAGVGCRLIRPEQAREQDLRAPGSVETTSGHLSDGETEEGESTLPD